MERVQWILNNWHLVSAVLAVAAFVIFDVYENRTGGKWSLPIKVYLGAILVLLATIMVSLAMQHRPHIDHLRAQLRVDYAKGNPYLEDKIDTALNKLKDQLDGQQLGTTATDMTLDELIRGVKHTGRQDLILATDYGILPWQTSFRDYQDANLAAPKRGVAVTRVFIIPDQLLQNGDRLTSLLSAMKEQNENGITVKVALKSKLDQQPKYKFKQGMVLLEYQNREPVLMEESNGYYETGYNGFPSAYTMRVTWGEARVREYEEFLGWLVSEAPSDTVCDFAPTEEKERLLRNSDNPCQPNTRVGSLGRFSNREPN